MSCCLYIDCTNQISIFSIDTFHTLKLSLGEAVLFGYVFTTRTCATGVALINRYHFAAGPGLLVFKLSPELESALA
jgi:hypothetical protein